MKITGDKQEGQDIKKRKAQIIGCEETRLEEHQSGAHSVVQWN
jgi:hypothetical protein